MMKDDGIGLGKPTTLAKEIWDWKEGWDGVLLGGAYV